ncbi:MAG TPA: hypothetical protein VFG50_14800 [Rhodothermales bacterium]|nr:hypothetical protein [Rhodothermales bacterium]
MAWNQVDLRSMLLPPVRYIRAGTLLGLFLLGAGSVSAQTPIVPYPEWICLGAGETSHDILNVNLSYNFQPGRVAWHIAAEYNGAFPAFGGPVDRYLAGLNAGAGLRQVHPFFLMAEFIGPALMVRKLTDMNRVTTRSVLPGVTAVAQLYIKPLGPLLPEVGIGMELHGTATSAGFYRGLRFALLFDNGL